MTQHTGGGRFGKVRNSWPFVKLTIDDDSISMKTILQEVRMKREWIQAIILQKYFLNYRFIFKHNEPIIEKDIEFWSFSHNPVVNALRSKGYSVSEGR
jgi:spore germination protein YaaH